MNPRSMIDRCAGVTRDGTPCNAPPLLGGDYCVFHDPARAEEIAAGRAAGGRMRSHAAVAERDHLRYREELDRLRSDLIRALDRVDQITQSVALPGGST